jgi:hypothetical protein
MSNETEKPTLDQIVKLMNNQETRIDYNFNTTLQMTILVEYIFQKLTKQFPDLKLEEDYEEFQTKRLEEFNKMIEEIAKAPEELAPHLDEIIKNINI